MKQYFLRSLYCAAFSLFATAAFAVDPPKGTYFESHNGDAYVFTTLNDGSMKIEKLPSSVGTTYTAEMKDGRLWVTCHLSMTLVQVNDIQAEWSEVLEPSSSKAGAWDLIMQSDGYAPETAHIVPLPRPVPSLLHPIGIEGEAYFRLLAKSTVPPVQPADNKQLVELAFTILAIDENDSARRAIVLDALLRAGRMREFADRFAAWEADFEADPNPGYGYNNLVSRRAIASWRLTEVGRNGYDRIVRAIDDKTDLQHRHELMPKLLDYPEALPREPGIYRNQTVNFLATQTAARLMIIEAQFDLMRGKRDRALRTEAAVYRMGQCFDHGSTELSLFAGCTVRSIAGRALELHVLNACETEDELREATAMLTSLEVNGQNWKQDDIAKQFPREFSGLMMNPGEKSAGAEARNLTANIPFWFAKAILGARYTKLKKGKWPTSPADFYPLGETPPLDPYNDKPFLFAERGGGFQIWSVGPDRDDDMGSLDYDPTNGTISDGDIATMIPPERYYPFPAKEFRPNSAGDVKRVFAHGLPPDPFADVIGTPYTVNDGKRFAIFSFGPDVDQARTVPGAPLQAQYDPTNGVSSAGNLYYEPPK